MKEKFWKVGVSFKLKIFTLVLPKRGNRIEVKMQRLRMKKKKKNKMMDYKRVRHELEVKICNGVLQCRTRIVENETFL